jgi:hypothetical protein
MSIVSSVHVVDPAQIDGRAYVTEIHTDHLGGVYTASYLAAVGTDYVAVRTQRAAALEVSLAESECRRVIQLNLTLTLNHQTQAQFAARFWARVRDARGNSEIVNWSRMIWWLIERINAGDITDAGARTTFNTAFNRSLTAGQWTTFKTDRLIPIHDRYAAMLAEGDL